MWNVYYGVELVMCIVELNWWRVLWGWTGDVELINDEVRNRANIRMIEGLIGVKTPAKTTFSSYNKTNQMH